MTKPSPLQGIRVIDFTAMMSGPFATRMLADCGAEVIKVEAEGGDYMRYRSPLRGGRSSYYGQMNGGKKSIVLNLKSPEGAAIARELIATADVVVENYRPGVMKKFCLSWEDLKDDFPKLVFCSITGFGQAGERAGDPAYAPIIHAASGYDLAHMHYNAHLEKPAITGIFTADVMAAIYAFGAIQTALLHRERFGVGQHVDVTLIDSMLNMLIYETQEAQFQTGAGRPLYQPLRTTDGFVMVAPVNQKNFIALAHAIGRPEWLEDARFCTITQREQNWSELMREIETWTETRTARDCEDILMRAGVPCSRYATVSELLVDRVMVERGTYQEVEDGSGRFSVPRQPFLLSEATVSSASWVSDAGADADEILSRVLGKSEDEIADLRRRKVV